MWTSTKQRKAMKRRNAKAKVKPADDAPGGETNLSNPKDDPATAD